jgi:regulator of sigma E protease
MSILLVLAILVFLIVVHELGHFLVAKWSKVRVDEFGIGYPPRAFTFGTWGGTEYTLNWLPFGGFVKLFGEDGKDGIAKKDKGQTFFAAPKWKQALILIAGVVGNLLAAWLLFAGAFALGAPAQVADGTPGSRVVVSAVIADSPAEFAGVAIGDEIKSIIALDGKSGLAEITPTGVAEFVQEYGGKPLVFTYERIVVTEENKRIVEAGVATVTPAHGVLPDSSGRPALGIAMVSVSDDSMPFWKALGYSIPYTGAALVEVSKELWRLASQALTGQGNLAGVVGPIGLVDVVDQTTPYGIGRVMALAAFISINLVIINLLPIPALDGGRLLFLGIESVIRRPLPEMIMRIVNTIGFALIILLMIGVTYNDVARLIG